MCQCEVFFNCSDKLRVQSFTVTELKRREMNGLDWSSGFLYTTPRGQQEGIREAMNFKTNMSQQPCHYLYYFDPSTLPQVQQSPSNSKHWQLDVLWLRCICQNAEINTSNNILWFYSAFFNTKSQHPTMTHLSTVSIIHLAVRPSL